MAWVVLHVYEQGARSICFSDISYMIISSFRNICSSFSKIDFRALLTIDSIDTCDLLLVGGECRAGVR